MSPFDPDLYQPLHQTQLSSINHKPLGFQGQLGKRATNLTHTHPQYFIVVYFLSLHKYKQLQMQISTQNNDLPDIKMQITLEGSPHYDNNFF